MIWKLLRRPLGPSIAFSPLLLAIIMLQRTLISPLLMHYCIFDRLFAKATSNAIAAHSVWEAMRPHNFTFLGLVKEDHHASAIKITSKINESQRLESTIESDGTGVRELLYLWQRYATMSEAEVKGKTKSETEAETSRKEKAEKIANTMLEALLSTILISPHEHQDNVTQESIEAFVIEGQLQNLCQKADELRFDQTES